MDCLVSHLSMLLQSVIEIQKVDQMKNFMSILHNEVNKTITLISLELAPFDILFATMVG